jgi:hypothetical protein
VRAEVRRVNGRKTAAAAADGRADGVDDVRFCHECAPPWWMEKSMV